MGSTSAIVTGDRHATEQEWARTIGIALKDHGVWHVYHGDARGIDTIAANEAEHIGIGTTPHPADWNRYGKSAGLRRNEEMLEDLLTDAAEGGRIIVIAFHHDLANSKGTGHMVRIARAAGVRVVHYDAPIPEPKEL